MEALGVSRLGAFSHATVRATLSGVAVDDDDWTETIDVNVWRRPVDAAGET